MSWNQLVPWDADGNMMPYTDRTLPAVDTWTHNVPIKKRMRFVGPGDSSRIVTLEDTDGVQYPMFLSDFYKLVQTSRIEQGEIYHREWIVRKAGNTYGIVPRDWPKRPPYYYQKYRQTCDRKGCNYVNILSLYQMGTPPEDRRPLEWEEPFVCWNCRRKEWAERDKRGRLAGPIAL